MYIKLDIYVLILILRTVSKEFEDTKGVIKIRKSKNWQHNGQKKKVQKDKQRLQNIHIKLNIE